MRRDPQLTPMSLAYTSLKLSQYFKKLGNPISIPQMIIRYVREALDHWSWTLPLCQIPNSILLLVNQVFKA